MKARGARAVGFTCVAVVAGLAAIELVFRSALFGDGLCAQVFGERLRDPRLYADPTSEDAYWQLQIRFLDPTQRLETPGWDPEVGWVGPRIDPGSLELLRPVREGRGRPILLYGDSFANCARGMQRDHCFEGLVARSDLAEDYELLNYGVTGYGLDQIYLLLRKSVDQYADEHPLVVVSLLVDDDLDRMILGFRGWPKPRLQVEGDRLVIGNSVPETLEQYLDENPVGIRSFAWRYLVYGTRILPSAWAADLRGRSGYRREKKVIARAVLEEIVQELRSRSLDFFFLLFHGQNGMISEGPYSWRERLLHRFFAEHDVPFVSSRTEFRADAARSGRHWRDYFLKEGVDARHYNALGNEVAFGALHRGVLGAFDRVPDGGAAQR